MEKPGTRFLTTRFTWGNWTGSSRRWPDGNPNVEFIDVGTYGLWGEGHTHGSSQQDHFDVKKLHIDLHLKHFKKTLLCISDDFAGHDQPGARFPITDYALSKGVTLRDDSILVQPPPKSWYHAELAQAFWPKFPVILEHQHYGASKLRKAWNPELLLKSVEDYHASFMSIHWWPRELLEANREIINQINLRMGYRLQPLAVTSPESIQIGKPFSVQWTWANKGVAPCHPGGFPCLTLKDAEGGIVSVLVDESLDLRSLKVGPPGSPPLTEHQSTFIVGLTAPTTMAGPVDVFVSVGERDGTPRIALPEAFITMKPPFFKLSRASTALLVVLVQSFAPLSTCFGADSEVPKSGAVLKTRVDASTLNGKVMCGYQGWFNTPGDGQGLGWRHYSNPKTDGFEPGKAGIEFWPDVSELGPNERFDTAFRHTDGSVAQVFSSAVRETVVRHFKWMEQYGIDGVFVQRFATEVTTRDGRADTAKSRTINKTLEHCREGAKLHGRTYAVMYDLSSMTAPRIQRVKDDWRFLVKEMGILKDNSYQRHNGRPTSCSAPPPTGAMATAMPRLSPSGSRFTKWLTSFRRGWSGATEMPRRPGTTPFPARRRIAFGATNTARILCPSFFPDSRGRT
jgi:hypothetical protein